MSIKLICLGVGNGSSYVLRGNPSSSFVITLNDLPFLLVDCGVGIGLKYKEYFGDEIPTNIFITHNHLDHTGDLPIVLIDFFKRSAKPINIFGHNDVLEMVKKHRMHEFYSIGIDIEKIANWNVQNEHHEIYLNKAIKLELIKSQHSYLCYGFNLILANKAIFGYSGDSGFKKEVYNFISQADSIVVDGRKKGGFEHASLLEIEQYAIDNSEKKYYVIHHEFEDYEFKENNVKYLKEGDKIKIKE